MSIEFAEKIIDSMVDENGHCGERGLSPKQFNILSEHLFCQGEEDAGCWRGDYGFRQFTSSDWEGVIGKYNVVLNEYRHFHNRYTVVSIDLRPAEEIEREKKLASLAKFENSEWCFEPKKRLDLNLILVRDCSFFIESYRGYGCDLMHIYQFADDNGNCFIWKTQNLVEVCDEDGSFRVANEGDVVSLKGTVKAHSEYRGIKQTVLTRCKPFEIKAA